MWHKKWTHIQEIYFPHIIWKNYLKNAHKNLIFYTNLFLLFLSFCIQQENSFEEGTCVSFLSNCYDDNKKEFSEFLLERWRIFWGDVYLFHLGWLMSVKVDWARDSQFCVRGFKSYVEPRFNRCSSRLKTKLIF